MKKQQQDFQILPFTKLRRVMALTLHAARRTPMIHGLIEVDVTKARAHLKEHKAKTGESLSFTAITDVDPLIGSGRVFGVVFLLHSVATGDVVLAHGNAAADDVDAALRVNSNKNGFTKSDGEPFHLT